jgi:hypothetical protein
LARRVYGFENKGGGIIDGAAAPVAALVGAWVEALNSTRMHPYAPSLPAIDAAHKVGSKNDHPCAL